MKPRNGRRWSSSPAPSRTDRPEIGVQQITELLPIAGIDFLGPLPNELQTKIGYATARPLTGKQPEAAAALVKFMSSAQALPVMKKMGLEPW